MPRPPYSYVGILTPNVVVLGDETSGKGLGHVGGILTNGIYAPMTETQTAPSPFHPCDDTARGSPSMTQEMGPYQTQSLLVP